MSVTLANILLGACTVSLDDTDVGATRGPVTVAREAEYLRVMCEQFTGCPKVHLVTEGYTISFTMLELTLANIQMGFLGESDYTSGALTIGGDDTPAEIEIDVYGTNPAGFARTINWPAAVFIEPGEITMGKEDVHNLPCKALALADEITMQFGTITDATE